MQLLLNKKFLIALALLALLTTILSLVLKPRDVVPKVVSSSPANGSTNVTHFDSIEFVFDHPLDQELVLAQSIPAEDWVVTPSGTNVVVLRPKKYLRVDTPYSLSLRYAGEEIYSLSFKTIPQQSDPRYAQQVVEDLRRDYPLAHIVPHETPLYRIVYTSPLALEITIINQNLTSQEIIAEVKSWVSQNGGDASSHKYTIAP